MPAGRPRRLASHRIARPTSDRPPPVQDRRSAASRGRGPSGRPTQSRLKVSLAPARSSCYDLHRPECLERMGEQIVVAGLFGELYRATSVGRRLTKTPSRRFRPGLPRQGLGLPSWVPGPQRRLFRELIEGNGAIPLTLQAVAMALLDQTKRERKPVAARGKHLVARSQLGLGLCEVGFAGCQLPCLAGMIDDRVDALDRAPLELERVSLRGGRQRKSGKDTPAQNDRRRGLNGVAEPRAPPSGWVRSRFSPPSDTTVRGENRDLTQLLHRTQAGDQANTVMPTTESGCPPRAVPAVCRRPEA